MLLPDRARESERTAPLATILELGIRGYKGLNRCLRLAEARSKTFGKCGNPVSGGLDPPAIGA